MPNVASVLKEEIRRLARKEAKAIVAPLKKALRMERRARAELRKQLAASAKAAGRAVRQAATAAVPAAAAAAARKSKSGRALTEGWRKDTVRSTRKALGLSQGQFAKLVGVSQITVSFWENGKSTPRMTQQAAVLAARDLGRDKALARLGLPPGYKARRGRPSNADLAARKQSAAKPTRKKAARKAARKAGKRRARKK